MSPALQRNQRVRREAAFDVQQIARLAETGTTDLCVFPFAVDEGTKERTLELLGDIAGGAR